jgi:hypothetical protein
MSSETSEPRSNQSKRTPRREPATGPSQPAAAPALNDGIEQVRDSHC